MTSSRPREYRQAVRWVNCVNPASWSIGRIKDLISLLTTELFIDLQYTDIYQKTPSQCAQSPRKGQDEDTDGKFLVMRLRGRVGILV